MNYPKLNRHNAPKTATILLSGAPKTGIVHLGIGNFHRAHLSIYTAKTVRDHGGDWGIFAHSRRNKALADAITEQDNLYSVLTISPDSEETLIPGIHTAVHSGLESVELVMNEIAKPSTKIVSLTVTEAGYSISQKSGGLDFDLPELKQDLDLVHPPQTTIGLLSRALLLRARNVVGPITVLSCDNLSGNGDLTSRLVYEFCGHLPSAERETLEAFLNTSVSFPNSMVDRIVPTTEERHLRLVEERLGVHDSVPVAAEAFSMWVVEDKFVAGRPAWESVGVIFSDEVENYETLKLRLLNGTHSLLAYLGGLNQCKTIPESRFMPVTERAARAIINNEFIPTLHVPAGLDVDAYVSQLFSRWSNTALGDGTSRVGSDGSTKLPQRITIPVQHAYASGKVPKLSALTVAAWLSCITPLKGFVAGSVAAAMEDPSKKRLQVFAEESGGPVEFISRVFRDGRIFDDSFVNNEKFIELVTDLFTSIYEEGIEAATELALLP